MAHSDETVPSTRLRQGFGAAQIPGAFTYAVGNEAVRFFVDERVVLGASKAADVVLQDELVSRLHCEITREDDGLWVRDLASTNGTFVQGVRVSAARVELGMVVTVGSTSLTACAPSQRGHPDLWPSAEFEGLVGASAASRRLFARIARAAPTSSTVLIQGETGTGKELVARALHSASPRAKKPYIVVDCSALPATLLQAELFGHAKGAFTGANTARVGALEEADGGTLFLDEIGELPVEMQPALLRFIESRTIKRLGETHARPVDVRIVAATHRNLQQMVNQGTFREDLYFRLHVVPIHVPALHERSEDIPMLMEHFAKQLRVPLDPVLVSQACIRSWPGNVRALRNFVERGAALGTADATLADPTMHASTMAAVPELNPGETLVAARTRMLEQLDLAYLKRALVEHEGNITAVARASGLHRSHIYRLLLKYGLA